METGRIYVIHENNAWVDPLRTAFRNLDLPFEEWFLDTGMLDLSGRPPDGVFYNRMSASSHSRGHRFAAEYAGAVLSWLEQHGCRVINGGRALQLEVSKVAQYGVLSSHGVRTPRTVAAVGRDEIALAGREFSLPFITKHNRAGKGLGVRLFNDHGAFERYVGGAEFEPSVDGITLIQEYIDAPEPFITRVEFVGGRFLYAVRVDTRHGFELCPADACQVDDAFCPVGETPERTNTEDTPMFQIVPGVGDDFGTQSGHAFGPALVDRYERVLAENGIQIAGIEFILDRKGVPYTYDINTNTNYNQPAEAVAGLSGMNAIAAYLGRELRGRAARGAPSGPAVGTTDVSAARKSSKRDRSSASADDQPRARRDA